MSSGEWLRRLTLGICLMFAANCSGSDASSAQASLTIRITGSDTMVNLVQAWAENYKKKRPDVAVQVAGGGSGVGIAGLIDGILDIAASSREIEAKEIDNATRHNGVKPTEFKVALDGLAIYTHRSNPIERISIEELADIYGEGGTILKWASSASRTRPAAATRSFASAGRTTRGPTSTSAKRSWGRHASSRWVRSTRAARRTSSSSCPARRAPSATAEWPT